MLFYSHPKDQKKKTLIPAVLLRTHDRSSLPRINKHIGDEGAMKAYAVGR